MPNPFILFENHFNVSTKMFIANHAASLKALGYKKLLLEMSIEMDPQVFRAQLKRIVAGPNKSMHTLSQIAYLKMIDAVEENGITFEFIDPETIAQAQKQAISPCRYQHEALSGVKQRDEVMAATIFKQAERYSGGVLFVGGFLHNSLVSLLNSYRTDYFRYAIFESQNPISPTKLLDGKDITSTLDRHSFYGTHVNYFDMSLNPTFELIATEAQLTTREKCAMPLVGEYLQEALQHPCDFNMAKQNVVSAVMNVDERQLSKVTSILRSSFKGLNFFTKINEGELQLSIPGINLPENGDALKRGFRSLGVMQ